MDTVGICVGTLTAELGEWLEQVSRDRSIKILRLAQQIEAEMRDERINEADLSDEAVQRIAELLAAPSTARRRARSHQTKLSQL